MLLKDLEPVSAHLCLRIERICINELALTSGSRVLLAVSGGADSAALALVMHIIAPRLGISLSAMHINHLLRTEAAAEAEFAVHFCADLDIPCALVSADIGEIAQKRHCGLEEAGRAVRRELLHKQASQIGADFIMLGHHREDLAEDIMMRLVRGTGWPGLGGMAWRSGMFLRPLLHTDPKELRELLLTCGFSWCEDASNDNLKFKRNRFRHIILPVIRCENPSLSDGLLRLHRQALLDEDYWNGILNAALAIHPWQIETGQNGTALTLPSELLAGLHSAARMRLYHLALKRLRKLCGNTGQNRADTLERLDRAWLSRIGGKLLQCGGEVSALCKNGGIIFQAAGNDDGATLSF